MEWLCWGWRCRCKSGDANGFAQLRWIVALSPTMLITLGLFDALGGWTTPFCFANGGESTLAPPFHLLWPPIYLYLSVAVDLAFPFYSLTTDH